MSFVTDIIRTLANKLRIGNFLVKEVSQGLAIRNNADSENANIVCDELVVSGSVNSDRLVRIKRSPSATASYTLILPPNAGTTGDKLILSAPGTLIFAEDNAIVPPIKGGTGLSSLGSPGQSIRVNAEGTGFEFYTPSTVIPGDTSGSFEEEDMFNYVLYKDSNWGLYDQSSQRYAWRSYIPQWLGNSSAGESATGAIEFGYATLSNNLLLFFSGGGNSGGTLKKIQLIRASDNVLLIDTTLNALMPVDTGGLLPVFIDTNSYIGTKVKLKLIDDDTGSGWSWMGFYPQGSAAYV